MNKYLKKKCNIFYEKIKEILPLSLAFFGSLLGNEVVAVKRALSKSGSLHSSSNKKKLQWN